MQTADEPLFITMPNAVQNVVMLKQKNIAMKQHIRNVLMIFN